MHIRYLKVLMALIASFMCIFYVAQNFANPNPAFEAFAYVMGGADHAIYADTFAFHISNPTLTWLALLLIFALELLAGLLLLKGSYDMWQARKADVETFTASKKWAEIGAGAGILVWFGFFGVLGAAFFQMWQTAIGAGSMDDAFQFFVSMAVTLLFLNQADR